MGNKKIKVKVHHKKDERHKIEQQLSEALQGLKEQLGEKKFSSRIKKAGKLFAKGLIQKKKPMPLNKKKAIKAPKIKETVVEG